MKRALIVLGGLLAVSAYSYAEPLPKGATPLQPSEVRVLYSGRTMRYGPDCSQGDTGRVVWLSNGIFRGIADLGNKRPWAIYEGRWSVSGNRMCSTSTAIITETKMKFSETRCTDFYRSGNAIYGVMSVSKGELGACSKAAMKDYWRYRPLSKGDFTSPDYERIKKKLQQ